MTVFGVSQSMVELEYQPRLGFVLVHVISKLAGKIDRGWIAEPMFPVYSSQSYFHSKPGLDANDITDVGDEYRYQVLRAITSMSIYSYSPIPAAYGDSLREVRVAFWLSLPSALSAPWMSSLAPRLAY